MNKITPGHLSRSAYVYVRQSTPEQLINNPESRRFNTALRPAHRRSAGKMQSSSTMTLAAPEEVRRAPASIACWQQSVRELQALYWPWRPRAWPVMGAIGTLFWNSALW